MVEAVEPDGVPGQRCSHPLRRLENAYGAIGHYFALVLDIVPVDLLMRCSGLGHIVLDMKAHVA